MPYVIPYVSERTLDGYKADLSSARFLRDQAAKRLRRMLTAARWMKHDRDTAGLAELLASSEWRVCRRQHGQACARLRKTVAAMVALRAEKQRRAA